MQLYQNFTKQLFFCPHSKMWIMCITPCITHFKGTLRFTFVDSYPHLSPILIYRVQHIHFFVHVAILIYIIKITLDSPVFHSVQISPVFKHICISYRPLISNIINKNKVSLCKKDLHLDEMKVFINSYLPIRHEFIRKFF